jgi:hypothetical protein
MRSPGDRSTKPQHAELDEFTQENRASAAVKMETAGNSLFVFECEPEPVAPIAKTGELFDVTRAEPVVAPRPAALSRGESEARRREHRRHARVVRFGAHAAAWRAQHSRLGAVVRFEAQRGSSALRRAMALVTHKSSSASAASRQAMRRTSLRLRERMRPAPSPITVTAFDYQESNGFVVAVLLGMAVVGYGSFLVGSWRSPGVSVTRAAALTTDAAAQRPRPVVAARPGTATAGTSLARPAMGTGNPLAGTPRIVAARPVAVTPNARTLNAMWQRRDTRSLDQAFNSLRQQTLAFHRCGMRVIDAERAVARCEGVASAGTPASRATTWTIDFRRTAGRWAMARVATRPSTGLAKR